MLHSNSGTRAEGYGTWWNSVTSKNTIQEEMVGVIHSNLPVFYDKGFDNWCVKIDVILGFQEVDKIVKKDFKEPLKGDSEEANRQHKENEKLDCKARMLLHQFVSAAIFQKISKAVTAKEVWDILQDGYGNSSKVKKIRLQSLQRNYELLGMRDRHERERFSRWVHQKNTSGGERHESRRQGRER